MANLHRQEISREEVFNEFGRAIDKVIYRMPDGKHADFYLRREGHSVVVLALTKDKQIVLAKQFRPGPATVLWEMPGGGKHSDESPEDAIVRELREETGYVGKVQFVTRCWDDAYSDRHRYVFIATECEKVGEPVLDETEFADVVAVSLHDFRELLRKGLMTDVEAGYLGLDYLGLLESARA